MSHKRLSNLEFLDAFLAKDTSLERHVLLPHEGTAVDAAVEKQKKAYEQVVEQKIDVTGGDDWHDGAFRATDNEAKIIGQQMSAIAPYIGATIVGYPEKNEQRATIGSRIIVVQNDFPFPIDIVGFRAGYPEDVVDEELDDTVTGMSTESPLARILLGHEAGTETVFNNGERDVPVKILSINQLAVREYFARHEQVLDIT